LEAPVSRVQLAPTVDDFEKSIGLYSKLSGTQMAALMRSADGLSAEARPAGTRPGSAITTLSAEAIAEVGADMSIQVPGPIDLDLLVSVDRVVVPGSEAAAGPVGGMAGTIGPGRPASPQRAASGAPDACAWYVTSSRPG
jgi:hypothetical protein